MSSHIDKSTIVKTCEFHLDKNLQFSRFFHNGIETTALVQSADSGKRYVCKIHENKFYDNPSGFLAGPQIMKIVQNNSTIPVPSIYVSKNSTESNFNKPFYIMEFVEGESYNFPRDVTEEYHKEIIQESAKILGKLHSIETDDFTTYGWLEKQDSELVTSGDNSSFQSVMDYMIWEEFWSKISSSYESDPKIFSDMLPTIKELNTVILDTVDFTSQTALCYWDMKYENFILTEDGIKSIIDWDNPMITDPIFNYVKATYNLIRQYEILEEMSSELRNTLESEFRKQYNVSSPYLVDLSDSAIQDKVIAYRYYILLESLYNFEDWYGNHTEKERNQARNYYQNELERIESHFE